jgi:cytochrome c biogenesis protein CcmG, thiol:disulfide interchange protein DsbE
VTSTFVSRINRQSILFLLVLAAGGVWIWLSAAAPESSTNGHIPAAQKGFLAPDFTLETTDGEQITLSSLRGRPVVLNFWASWCPPCKAEMPALQRVYQGYQDKGLVVLGVDGTYQDDPQEALNFLKSKGLSFPVVFDDQGQVASLYAVHSLPTTFFIDSQGMIQEVIVGGPMAEALLRVRVDQLLANTSTGNP